MDNRKSFRVGDKFGPFEYTITEEMADLHLAAIDNSDAVYRDIMPDGRRMLPPCFTARDYVYLLLQKGIWGSGGIQTAQESEFYNPGHVGQRLVCTGEIIERYVKKNKHYMVFEYRIVDSSENPIATHRMTAMVFDIMQTRIEPKKIEVGTKLPPLEKCVSDTQVALSYRRLLILTEKLDDRFNSYINEPNIHTDDSAARAAGFSGRVAPGLQAYSFISEMLGRCFGMHWIAGGKIRLNFILPFLIGEKVTCEAEVIRIQGSDKSSARFAELDVNCRNANGDIVTNGSAMVRIA